MISFDVGAVFSEQEIIYQWVTFDIPPGWLGQGPNEFYIYTQKPYGTWDHNNLRVGVDTDNDFDRSWWCGNGVTGCNNPALRNGELMIYLEVCSALLGDLNCDGPVDVNDVTLLIQALIDPAGFTGCEINRADMNSDTLLDGGDIAPFMDVLLGP